jgi:hypothetical protein
MDLNAEFNGCIERNRSPKPIKIPNCLSELDFVIDVDKFIDKEDPISKAINVLNGKQAHMCISCNPSYSRLMKLKQDPTGLPQVECIQTSYNCSMFVYLNDKEIRCTMCNKGYTMTSDYTCLRQKDLEELRVEQKEAHLIYNANNLVAEKTITEGNRFQRTDFRSTNSVGIPPFFGSIFNQDLFWNVAENHAVGAMILI